MGLGGAGAGAGARGDVVLCLMELVLTFSLGTLAVELLEKMFLISNDYD